MTAPQASSPVEGEKTGTPDENGWFGISCAPKDGTVIDLWHEEWGRQPDCYWGKPHHCCGEAGSYCDSDWHGAPEGWVDSTFNTFVDDFTFDHFTHWRPQPLPPAAEGRAARKDGA